MPDTTPTRNTFNNKATIVQGPMGDDYEIELWKAWMMVMPMNNGDISMTTMSESEQANTAYKKFLYARVTHSNHVIQYRMQQIMERQKVVDEYRSMMVEGINLIPLESNSYKSDLVVISHTIQMIEVDNFWHLKTFEVVLANLQRRWDEEIHKHKDKSLHCTENDKMNGELDEKEVVDLCSESQTATSVIYNGEESRKQESCNTEESKAITRLESKTRPEKDHQADETEEIEVVMMCWKNSEGSLGKEPYKEKDDQEERADGEMQKLKDEEEHVDSTLHTGNQLNILIKEFSGEWKTMH